MLKNILKNFISRIGSVIGVSVKNTYDPNVETSMLALGTILTNQQLLIDSTNINDYEFKIFSQFGDDGIIQYLIRNIKIENETFIEFGVESYYESNTRFLLMNNNWSGFVMDGSKESMQNLYYQSWYWRYDLNQKAAFIDKENVNDLIRSSGFSNLGLLHIDGNDYHILEEIDFSELNPSILIMEYNSVFGNERLISTPYRKDFYRTKAHYSNLYFGASLPALNFLANKKGYALVGCNKAGNNSFFVRKDLLNEKVKEISIDQAYKVSKFRESRDINNDLTYISGNDRMELLRGMEVLNVVTQKIENI
ncbi:MAG: hypothetical protein IPP61_14465 [Cytophagaceae bacterium]|nr:hypothetical protein [Cytophagaceae bacterium]MBK9932777.1 hypothetical protein [Cytophagaceae bacterium]MBL0303534.1 hypothetical protein [Cytophagaceae bacterium]MBL0326361.1 hypothetical protein [Cytophagaceae bacterium]